jgi:hypothetical protein
MMALKQQHPATVSTSNPPAKVALTPPPPCVLACHMGPCFQSAQDLGMDAAESDHVL